MNCFAIAGVVDLHREGRLSPSRSREVQKHLDSCAVCAATLGPAAPEPGRPAPALRAPSALKDRLKASAAAAPPADAGSTTGRPLFFYKRPSPALWALAFVLGSIVLLHLGLKSLPESQREAAQNEFSVRRLP